MRSAVVTNSANATKSSPTMLLDVDGMKCGGCVRSVERTLLDQPGVCEASVNLVTRSAWLRFEDDADADLDGVVEALTARGFSAHLRDTNAFGSSLEADRSWGWW